MSTQPKVQNQIAKADQRQTVRDLVEKMKPQIRLALPKHLDPNRMARVFLTAVQRSPQLLQCTPESLAGALVIASQLGLEPDGILGHGYLVAFRNNKKGGIYECQFMPGYRGLMKVARQSGEISALYARAVHRRDHFEREQGLDEKLIHRPFEPDLDDIDERAKKEKWNQQQIAEAMTPGRLTHVYAVARFKDGGYQFEVMTRAEVELVRARSKSADDGPWVTDYEAMALKTVMKRLCKWIPGSVEKDLAVGLVDKAEAGESQDLGAIIDTSVTEPEPKDAKTTLDKITERHSKKAASPPPVQGGETVSEVVDPEDTGPCGWFDPNTGVVCQTEGPRVAGLGYRCGPHQAAVVPEGDPK